MDLVNKLINFILDIKMDLQLIDKGLLSHGSVEFRFSGAFCMQLLLKFML